MANEKVSELIFGNEIKPVSYYEEKYPPRKLKEGAVVTRYAPSPTGKVHMGHLYSSLIGQKLAHDTGGVYFLRIEDTDKKREVTGGIENIVHDLNHFHITFDEGMVGKNEEIGSYGPYLQSERREKKGREKERCCKQELFFVSFL